MSNEEMSFIIGALSLVVALIAILPMMTTKRKWLAAISLIVGMAFIIHGFYQTANRDQVTTENVESHVREWLDTAELGPHKVPDSNFFFKFKTEAIKGNPPIYIGRTKEGDRYLTIFSKIGFSDEDKTSFGSLSKSEQGQFYEKLRVEIARSKIGYIIEGLPFAITVLKRVPITKDLTEATFLDRIDEVGFAAVLVNDTIELELAELKRTPKKD
jgi:hypothetical protein